MTGHDNHTSDASPERLRTLIGREVRYLGGACVVIEVIEQGPAVVLQCTGVERVIQTNQYGEASRRVPQTHTVRVLTPDGRGYSDEFRALGLDL